MTFPKLPLTFAEEPKVGSTDLVHFGLNYQIELTDYAGLLLDFIMRNAAKSRSEKTFEIECGAFFAEVVQVFGVPKSIGQIYGLLFASAEPLSFSNIVERLDISKGSASQGLQMLRNLGAIKLVRPGNSSSVRSITEMAHRDYYEPELGLRRLLTGIIKERIEPLVGEGRTRLRYLHGLADTSTDAAQKEFRQERVAQIEIWSRQATLIMPVLKTMLILRNRD